MKRQDWLRQVDALVAEHVMGWEGLEIKTNGELWGCPPHIPVPHYSTDIAAAWEVVEKFLQDEWMLSIISIPMGYETSLAKPVDKGQNIPESYEPWINGEAPTTPLAICLAALKAKGIEIPKEVPSVESP